MGVNVIGTFLFTKLLTPTLVATAKTEPPNTVRVVWVSSLGTEIVGEKSYGISLDYLNYWPALKPLERYGISKAGNWLHGVEFAKRYQADGVVSIPCNPGHLRSDLYRDSGTLFKTVLNTLVAFPPINGAYTEIFAGLSPTITIKETGDWGEFLILLYSMTDFIGMGSCSTNLLIQCFSDPLGPTPPYSQRLVRRDQDRSRGREWLCEEILGVDRRPSSEVLVNSSRALSYVTSCRHYPTT